MQKCTEEWFNRFKFVCPNIPMNSNIYFHRDILLYEKHNTGTFTVKDVGSQKQNKICI